jgi:hypothetical protein
VERVVAATNQLIARDNSDLGFVNSPLVDYFLWGFRRELADAMEKFPYHKTRSVFY